MNNISNTIEIEYEGWTVEVKYNWSKGHPGSWLQPPDEDTIEIDNMEIISLINENGKEVAFDKNYMRGIPYDIIEQEIINDVDSFR